MVLTRGFKVQLEIKEGITLVNNFDDGDHIVLHTKEAHLTEVMAQIKAFLLASGYQPESVAMYIDQD